jgi:hypothetical protein
VLAILVLSGLATANSGSNRSESEAGFGLDWLHIGVDFRIETDSSCCTTPNEP